MTSTVQLARLATVASPAPERQWRRLFDQSSEALVTQAPEWSDCVRTVGGYADASRLYEFDDGHLALVPLARRRQMPESLAPVASWPFDWGIGGPFTTEGFGDHHARIVLHDLLQQPALQVSLRLNPFSAALWQAAAPAAFRSSQSATFVLSLQGGFSEVWASRFRSSVRRAVRKAERANLTVEVDQTGRLIPVFYDLYEQSIERWAKQANEPLVLARLRAGRANPRKKFEYVASRLGQACSTWVAWYDGEPAAAIVVLRRGSQSKYWRGAMNHSLASPVRANDLLHRMAIEQSCDAGCTFYHMGDSRPGSTLAAFKRGFGAEEMSSWTLFRERLPVSAAQHGLRTIVKRVIRFQDP